MVTRAAVGSMPHETQPYQAQFELVLMHVVRILPSATEAVHGMLLAPTGAGKLEQQPTDQPALHPSIHIRVAFSAHYYMDVMTWRCSTAGSKVDRMLEAGCNQNKGPAATFRYSYQWLRTCKRTVAGAGRHAGAGQAKCVFVDHQLP